jgi:hypothetical protein
MCGTYVTSISSDEERQVEESASSCFRGAGVLHGRSRMRVLLSIEAHIPPQHRQDGRFASRREAPLAADQSSLLAGISEASSHSALHTPG